MIMELADTQMDEWILAGVSIDFYKIVENLTLQQKQKSNPLRCVFTVRQVAIVIRQSRKQRLHLAVSDGRPIAIFDSDDFLLTIVT